jgi:hypothetical protein
MLIWHSSVHIFDENVIVHRQRAALVSARSCDVRARKCYSAAGYLLKGKSVKVRLAICKSEKVLKWGWVFVRARKCYSEAGYLLERENVRVRLGIC